MKDKKHHFELDFSVRDYECDLQGIVNNAEYLHYLEHTRHEFLKSIGLDFFALHKQGIDAVVTRLEIDYKFPLKSGDLFVVTLDLKKKGRLRYIFIQNIYSQPEQREILCARVICTCLYNGRPVVSEKIDRAAAHFLANE
ncbi:MAG: acyl-CoA thioesterase [Spirochaetales bacterium]|nr:acyl-CoA thioesterase [Spirochaetales bacterium]